VKSSRPFDVKMHGLIEDKLLIGHAFPSAALVEESVMSCSTHIRVALTFVWSAFLISRRIVAARALSAVVSLPESGRGDEDCCDTRLMA
jgi:hypothetical protein